jgi:hypothetical protein
LGLAGQWEQILDTRRRLAAADDRPTRQQFVQQITALNGQIATLRRQFSGRDDHSAPVLSAMLDVQRGKVPFAACRDAVPLSTTVCRCVRKNSLFDYTTYSSVTRVADGVAVHGEVTGK